MAVASPDGPATPRLTSNASSTFTARNCSSISSMDGWQTIRCGPPNRTPHMFRDWFAVESIDLIVDLDPQEPITLAEAIQTQCAQCGATLDEHVVAVAAGESV